MIVTLALVIGPATSIVSLAEAVLLRPLPLPNPEQLVLVTAANRERQREDASYLRLPEYSLTLNVIGVVTDVRHGQLQEAGGPQIFKGPRHCGGSPCGSQTNHHILRRSG